jgi:FixJ family two-component response regulator
MRLATSLLRAVRRPIDRTIQRRKEKRQQEEEVRRRANLTPKELAEIVLASALGERVETGDAEKLASRIARLADQDRYILALLAEGRTRKEVAYALWRDEYTVKEDMKLICKVLGKDARTDL